MIKTKDHGDIMDIIGHVMDIEFRNQSIDHVRVPLALRERQSLHNTQKLPCCIMRAFLLMLLLVVTRKNETYMAGSYKKNSRGGAWKSRVRTIELAEGSTTSMGV